MANTNQNINLRKEPSGARTNPSNKIIKTLCIQCKHYISSENPAGKCAVIGATVWSLRSECLSLPDRDLYEPLDTLGTRLRTARERAAKHRDEVCEDLSITKKTLQNWETDLRKPPPHTVKMLMDYYEK